MKKATTVDEIFQAFLAEPLKIEELEFYRPTAIARDGTETRKRLERLLRKNPNTAEHILFVAARGCGKSTELNHLQRDIQDDYLVFNYSVLKELNGDSVDYIELFIVTMERLFDFVRKNDLSISKEYLDNIKEWIASKEVQEIRDKHFSVDGEVGVDAKFGIPFLQQFFAKFKASAQSSRSFKETLSQTIEPRISEFINHCNALIQEIHNQLHRLGKKDLLIIIEDLDKIPYSVAERLFFNNTPNLVKIQANVIYTFPSSLRFNLRYKDISHYFRHDPILTMIKVHEKDGSDFADGIRVMRDIVEARMDVSLFEHDDLLLRLIRTSGGVLRDLFRLITDAAENAELSDRSKITALDCDRAYNQLRLSYRNLIADNRIGDQFYPVDNYYKALVALAESPDKFADNTEEVFHLRSSLCILDYNGTGWQDVHPVVRDLLVERKLIKK